ncbi:arylsulfatase [Luteolibacter algae]|uniref:Arylsulfatase n=1 Tax=Luteolibacter algae TaxID=454151 RepID=A0ABW5DD69_9BACT
MKPLLSTLFLLTTAVSQAVEKPNIIVIMADDLGYGDVSCYGATAIKTPNIDKLASEGQRFTSGYCSASTCTPTRYSMLTGTYAFRTPGTGIAPPNGPAIIRPGTTTLPSLMQDAGYKTAVIGKWHLGLGDEKPDWNGDLKPGPLEIGFDHCFLLPTTNDRVPQVYVEDHRIPNLDPADPLYVSNKPLSPNDPNGIDNRSELKMDWTHGHNNTIHNGISRIGFYSGGNAARFRDEDLADKWIERSNLFIEENKDKPFFLFFASHDVHVPRMPHERFHGKSGLGFRGDSILQLDWCVGELMKTLERLDLDENTLVVFCSDNGPVLDDGYADGAISQLGDHHPAGPFTGGKYTVFEGGTRTPFITRWKGKIPAGTSENIVCTIDFAASFAAMTGSSIPDDQCRDSFNVLPALLGEENAQGREHLLQQENGNKGLKGEFGLRSGDWKLVRSFHKEPTSELKHDRPAPGLDKVHTIYKLSEDPAEENDLSEENPAKLKELVSKLDEILAAERTRP